MKRCDMRGITLASVLWLCNIIPASAQEPPANIPVIGWLSPATTESYQQPGLDNPGLQLLRDTLAKHGLIDGKNIRLDMRLAEGKLDRLAGLAEALVREGATVILAYGEAAGRAAQAATKTLPIVCVGDDLVNSGLAASLARPGSNMTGGSILATELDAKRIEVLKDLLPDAKRFGVLNDPRRLGIELQTIDISGPDELGAAFEAFRGGRAEGVNIVSSAMLVSFRRPIGELSLGAKIPSICQFRNMAEAGCIASYGITIDDIYVISADQIAKLLKGAKPADLPVQQPTKFKLVINLKTAAALGIMVPPMLIARAEEVIE
jgi:putative ABC transport system substrate-binding protein